MNRILYLVAYDVASASRLHKALWIARDYASGGQKSVFECWLYPDELSELKDRFLKLLDLNEDRLLITRLQPNGKMIALGRARLPKNTGFIFLQ